MKLHTREFTDVVVLEVVLVLVVDVELADDEADDDDDEEEAEVCCVTRGESISKHCARNTVPTSSNVGT
jgi:hypothetical protein